MDNKPINFLISFIGILVLLHYFFAFDILWEYLGRYNLDMANIISWEDVQFLTAPIDMYLFITIILALSILIYLFTTFIFPNKIKIGFRAIKEKRRNKLAQIKPITLAIVILFFLILEYQDKGYISPLICIIYLTAIYLYHKHKSTIIILLSLFILTKLGYNYVIKEGSELYTNDVKLKLNDGKTVESDNLHKLVFFGTKYIVIESDSPNVKLYPIKEIKEIEWINKKQSIDTIKAAKE